MNTVINCTSSLLKTNLKQTSVNTAVYPIATIPISFELPWLSNEGEATRMQPSTRRAKARHFAEEREVPRTRTENPAVVSTFSCAHTVNSPAPIPAKATKERIFIAA